MEIKVLGPGCANCARLEKNVEEALTKSGKTATILKVTDPVEITTYGVMSTPGLVVDNKVVSYGRVLTTKEIEAKIN